MSQFLRPQRIPNPTKPSPEDEAIDALRLIFRTAAKASWAERYRLLQDSLRVCHVFFGKLVQK